MKLARQSVQFGGHTQTLKACLIFRCLAKRTEVEPPVRPRKRVKQAHPIANPAQEEKNPAVAAQPFTDVTNSTKHASPAPKSPKSSPSKSFETQLHQRGYMNVAGSQRPYPPPPPPLSLLHPPTPLLRAIQSRMHCEWMHAPQCLGFGHVTCETH